MYEKETLKKFNTNKSMKYFPGVSIVHNIKDSALNKLIIEIKNQYIGYDFFDKLIYLPEDSYHLTISNVITYKNRQNNPEFVNFPMLNSDSEIIDEFIVSALEEHYSKLNVTMVIDDFTQNAIYLKPKTSQDNEKLRNYRKYIHNKLNLPYNDDYKYHISIFYTLLEFDKNDKQEFKKLLTILNNNFKPLFGDVIINAADLTFFNDMSEFRNYSLGRVKLGTVKLK